MPAIIEVEAKTEPGTENRTMDERERLEQLRQRDLYGNFASADYRDAFEAGWDAGREFGEREKSNVQR